MMHSKWILIFWMRLQMNLSVPPVSITSGEQKIFYEDLKVSKSLGTTYYITDTKQMLDFFWYRESGLRLNLGIQDISVLPVLEEVDHSVDGDQEFVLNNPDSRLAQMFRKLQISHCRYPMADYYTLTVEKVNRSIGHDNTNDDLSCPEGHSMSACDPRHWEFNAEGCHGSIKEETERQISNSIECSSRSNLVRLFTNASSKNIKSDLPFDASSISSSCDKAMMQCQKCFMQMKCRYDNVDKYCQCECYSTNECKSSYNCRKKIQKCKQTLTTRLTLEPEYLDLENTFSCHLNRKKPEISYLLWFYVSIPDIGFETPRFYSRVEDNFPKVTRPNGYLTKPADSPESISGGVSDGTEPNRSEDDALFGHVFNHEFIKVVSKVYLPLDDEMLILGRKNEGRWVYNLRRIKDKYHDTTKKLNKTQRLKFLISNTKPFYYSSANWRQKINCDLNEIEMSELKENKTEGYKDSGGGDDDDDYNVSSFPSVDRTIKYLVTSNKDNPSVRITIPGNASLIKWWFANITSGLSLERILMNYVFLRSIHNVTLSGTASKCPEYLEITIKKWPKDGTLAHLDVILPCPRSFNFTISLIDLQSQSIVGELVQINLRTTKESVSRLLIPYAGASSIKDVKTIRGKADAFKKKTEMFDNECINNNIDDKFERFNQKNVFSYVIGVLLVLAVAYLIVSFSEKMYISIRLSKLKKLSGGEMLKVRSLRHHIDSPRKSKSIWRCFQILPFHLRVLVLLMFSWKCFEAILCTYTMFLLLASYFIEREYESMIKNIGNTSTGLHQHSHKLHVDTVCVGNVNQLSKRCSELDSLHERGQFLTSCNDNISLSLHQMRKKIEDSLTLDELERRFQLRMTNLEAIFASINVSFLSQDHRQMRRFYQKSKKLTNPKAFLDWLPPFANEDSGRQRMDERPLFSNVLSIHASPPSIFRSGLEKPLGDLDKTSSQFNRFFHRTSTHPCHKNISRPKISLNRLINKHLDFNNPTRVVASSMMMVDSKPSSELPNFSEIFRALNLIGQILKTIDFLLFFQRCLNLHDFVYFLLNLCENKYWLFYGCSYSTRDVLTNHIPFSAEVQGDKRDLESRLDSTRSHESRVSQTARNLEIKYHFTDLYLIDESNIKHQMKRYRLGDHRTLMIKFLSVIVIACLTQLVVIQYLETQLFLNHHESFTNDYIDEASTSFEERNYKSFYDGVIVLMNFYEENSRLEREFLHETNSEFLCSVNGHPSFKNITDQPIFTCNDLLEIKKIDCHQKIDLFKKCFATLVNLALIFVTGQLTHIVVTTTLHLVLRKSIFPSPDHQSIHRLDNQNCIIPLQESPCDVDDSKLVRSSPRRFETLNKSNVPSLEKLQTPSFSIQDKPHQYPLDDQVKPQYLFPEGSGVPRERNSSGNFQPVSFSFQSLCNDCLFTSDILDVFTESNV